MSFHPPRTVAELAYLLDVGQLTGAGKEAPAARVIRQAWGMKVSAAHTRRPRILRLEPSKPKGSKVGAGQ